MMSMNLFIELFSGVLNFAPQYFTFYQEAPLVLRVLFHATLIQSPFRSCPISNYSVYHDQLHSLEQLEVFRKFSEKKEKKFFNPTKMYRIVCRSYYFENDVIIFTINNTREHRDVAKQRDDLYENICQSKHLQLQGLFDSVLLIVSLVEWSFRHPTEFYHASALRFLYQA